MKDPVLAVITKLKVDTDVATLVGIRVYRATLPKNPQWPAIVVQDISEISDSDTSTSTQAHMLVQCTVFSQTDSQASLISKLIRKSLHQLTNTVLASGSDPVPIISIFDAGSRPDNNPEIEIWMNHRDFRIHYAY